MKNHDRYSRSCALAGRRHATRLSTSTRRTWPGSCGYRVFHQQVSRPALVRGRLQAENEKITFWPVVAPFTWLVTYALHQPDKTRCGYSASATALGFPPSKRGRSCDIRGLGLHPEQDVNCVVQS